MNEYVGTYRVFHAITLDGKPSSNEDDTFLQCKYKTQIYRYNDNMLAILFVAIQTVKNVLPQLKSLGVKAELLSEGDQESTYIFPEKDLSKVASILKPQIKGKNIKAKSIKTARKLKNKLL